MQAFRLLSTVFSQMVLELITASMSGAMAKTQSRAMVEWKRRPSYWRSCVSHQEPEEKAGNQNVLLTIKSI